MPDAENRRRHRRGGRRGARWGLGGPAWIPGAWIPGGWKLGALILGAWILGRLETVEVDGPSMWPTLEPEDRLLVLRRGGPWRRPRAGDLVILDDPRSAADAAGPSGVPRARKSLVKRAARERADHFEVRGDNPDASTDSRTFGTVPRRSIAGRAVYRYAPPDRVGRL